jgi:hypothetical protein
MISWLPPMVSVDGVWFEVISRLYSIFVSDIKEGKPCFRDREIWWDRRILPGETYEECFWHLVTKIDEETRQRLLDSRRAERLPWCAPTIARSTDPAVKVWDFGEGRREIRTYLWLEDYDYVVVLEKQSKGFRNIAFLVTAFHVDGESRKRALRKKYEARRA